MISIFNPPPASNPFHSPKLQSLFDDAVKQAWLNIAASPEMSMCIAAGVETETVMEGNRLVIRTVPKVAIADMGEGMKKIFVRYADESPQEVTASGRSAGSRRRRVQ